MQVLTAFKEVYHPDCFRCAVCGVCLDGIPYAGQHDKVYCIKDYHKLFAPPCSSCGNPIIPQPGKAKNVRVLVKDRYYHVRCYRCEVCECIITQH
ncbi:LIM domain-containing protein 1 [Geodia barretti]|uniref:LIM domain-containing protein 1 n=1 Tax=Geodia barretti TaxID=519541 RepID=A0AA35XJ68_GEOBA|nr:LIM domain-containing protein 1 [Geodia barretti]